MKKQELIKIIELVVRKEVKKQVNEIFIKEDRSSSLTELVSKPLTENHLNLPSKKQYKAKKHETINYTENEVLNNILNETVGGIQGGGTNDYPTMGGGTYDTNKMNDLLAGSYGMNTEGDKQQKRDIAAVESIKKAGVNVESVPDHVQNALTRDYSKVMKAIDEKKGGKHFRP
ncbi:hypothetical protein HOE22_05270 [Candidatus Woesearchaeota archaeon]|jgi:hypothetical protein|nr:hypothetical protein [Candidatus Woesearchaeota archaeon]MBT4731148.1 hypothetical protein [Candidatus Woesearchaeota archaeon]MBT5759051.1 hypothetical protein [Candidatus Neomarinimicrobiota bacterium]